MNKLSKKIETVRVSKKKGDDAFDQEQQLILRLPPGSAMALKHDIETGIQNLKEKLFIDIHGDQRTGTVRYGGQIFNAKLYDLPCVLETLKTTDKKSFYKTADICQILIANEDDDSQEEEESPKKKEQDKKYLWNHGITPPLKNVRKRRFRRQLRKKDSERPDIEKEVKRLFRTDNEAVSVRWEIVTDDDKAQESGTVGGPTTNAGETKERIDLEHIFGEVSSSEDDDDDKDLNVLDSEADDDDNNSRMMAMREQRPGVSQDDDSSRLSGGDMGNEMGAKLKELRDQLAELREKRQRQEAEIASIDNVALQKRFKEVLQDIIREEEEKTRDYQMMLAVSDQG